jgi:hypothetical protein
VCDWASPAGARFVVAARGGAAALVGQASAACAGLGPMLYGALACDLPCCA